MQSKKCSNISEVPLLGLLNSGSTCYLNTLLQCLYFTPELRTRLFAISAADLHLPDSHSSSSSSVPAGSKVRKIPLELQRLFAQLQASAAQRRAAASSSSSSSSAQEKKQKKGGQCLSTFAVTQSFGWSDNSEVLVQQDVDELNRLLLDGLCFVPAFCLCSFFALLFICLFCLVFLSSLSFLCFPSLLSPLSLSLSFFLSFFLSLFFLYLA